jgi:hypothetical protein
MPSVSEWKVPAAQQPKPEDYSFDLEQALTSIVGIRSIIPGDAFSAQTLGTERAGNGVIIRSNGLVLTIGYLVTEAETIWLHLIDGRTVPGHVMAYDQVTGFGLVQALARLDLPALPLGQSEAAQLAASARSPHASSASRNSPAIGNMCSTRRSSQRPRIRTGAAPASSGRPANCSASVRCNSSRRARAG